MLDVAEAVVVAVAAARQYQVSIQSKIAALSPARVGQARVSMSSRLMVAKKLSATALSQH